MLYGRIINCIRTALLHKMSESRQYFSQLEKSLVTELVRKHKDFIENKKNDYRTMKQKNSAWEALSEEFNSQSGVTKRDSKQLKKRWENVKAVQRNNWLKRRESLN